MLKYKSEYGLSSHRCKPYKDADDGSVNSATGSMFSAEEACGYKR